jgi:hypothetical protein
MLRSGGQELNDLIERMRHFVERKEFREFVRQRVRDWCDWHAEQTERVSELRLVSEGESEENTQRRFPKIDVLEGDPNYQLVAWADEERRTISSKCTLMALYWYRQKQKSGRCAPRANPPKLAIPRTHLNCCSLLAMRVSQRDLMRSTSLLRTSSLVSRGSRKVAKVSRNHPPCHLRIRVQNNSAT